MHYNVYEGAQNTWYDRFGSVSHQVTAHNWLPAAAAGMVILWIGLLFGALQQTAPTSPGRPSDLTATRSNPPMTVTAAPGDTVGQSSNSSTRAATQPVQSSGDLQAIEAPTTSSESPVTAASVIGGKGGDSEPLPSAALPSTPATPAADPTASLTVDTPLTSEPVTVDAGVTNDGLQLDANLDGIL